MILTMNRVPAIGVSVLKEQPCEACVRTGVSKPNYFLDLLLKQGVVALAGWLSYECLVNFMHWTPETSLLLCSLYFAAKWGRIGGRYSERLSYWKRQNPTARLTWLERVEAP